MLKKAFILILLLCLYSSYIDSKNIEYSNTLSYNVQEDIFYEIKKAGNYISTNIVNDEIKYYAKEAVENLFNTGKTIVINIVDTLKTNSSSNENTKMSTSEF